MVVWEGVQPGLEALGGIYGLPMGVGNVSAGVGSAPMLSTLCPTRPWAVACSRCPFPTRRHMPYNQINTVRHTSCRMTLNPSPSPRLQPTSQPSTTTRACTASCVPPWTRRRRT